AERGIISPGDTLPIFKINIKNIEYSIGMQLCREIRFPEQWKFLASQGADFFLYLTNAVNSESHNLWRSMLISRAAENQRYIVGCNIAHKKQLCPSMIIDPNGDVLKEVVSEKKIVITEELDLNEMNSWYIEQTILKINGM
ncbi:MAG: carbon-nitrogen hydrolase family protein, partial [Spirochaetales bacterium]|nr:carbon-nitrogen hydrolase family protein [Spirochaetales bacterium]